jgi:hypothetical protein
MSGSSNTIQDDANALVASATQTFLTAVSNATNSLKNSVSNATESVENTLENLGNVGNVNKGNANAKNKSISRSFVETI